MLQKLSVNSFEWIKDTCQFNEDFIKNYNGESDEGYFSDIDVQYAENLDDLDEINNDSPFLAERIKIEKVEKIVADLHDTK